METVLKAIGDWLKSLLTAGIMSNLSGLFDAVNEQVGDIAQQVGTRPSAFEPRVFAMIESLSRNVVLPIAGIILTFIACYELIEMITQHNNMAQFEPALIMRWVFKTAISVWFISNTFDIVMAVFDLTQKVVADSSGIIAGNTRVNDIGLSMLEASLMQMEVGPLFGLFLQSFFIGITMRILSIIIIDKGKSAVSTAINGLATAAKSNAHVLVIVGVFLLLILLVMSGFSSCGILFSGTTQVSGQTIYTAEDRDIKGAEADYKKMEKELDKKIKRTPTDHPGYNEYQYHLDPIEHDPWQLTSFLTTLYDDYTRSEVQAKLQEIFKKQYKLTTWVEVQIRYKTVWVISPAGIPVPTQVPYEYKIFHTKLENKGLETVIRKELDDDQWKRYKIFQETLGGRPYLFNGGLPPGGSDGSGESGIDYTVPVEALTDSEFAAIYEEAKKYVGTPYVWGGSSPETGFDCSGYVCWVYNQAGYDVGRTTANGLWNKCQKISEAEAKPGDLVFFKGTYDTPGMSHTGIYLGNGMMVSAGDPIKYANIHSSYWEQYLAGFGRLSK